MQLTLFTDYSLRTLIYLAAHRDKLCTVKDIALSFSLSRNHIVKVAHNLVHLGYVESTKGKGGGIKLAIAPEKIRLRELIMKLEPHLNLTECFSKEGDSCRITSICGLRHILNEALYSFLNTLDSYTLADTMPNPRKFAIMLRPPL